MIEYIKHPFHWSVAGLLIGLTVPLLLWLGNKKFGISSSLRHMCAVCFPAKIPFFQYNWKKESWNLFFVAGIPVGAYLAHTYLSDATPIAISADTQDLLKEWGITKWDSFLPAELFSNASIFTLKGVFFFVIGGFFVGFGTRYAGGCTSGHSIMGLSTLQVPSLIATCCFMIGGFFSSNILIPCILKFIL